ncbi:DM13 domain-containing protein [Oculatella sp. LEGE 06141]|uniref:DM13 domain-containing protein n=1 Tax=Oculatella sp. LEGE 06141 TaxID=1828648 RepID=UPI00187E53F1|nr:DM13 domain-containing protein [Oculatella sp. LEGE 06141]MBE9180190.1 DM13 domain-containing protein [Oculatella sp. LEGE 06141]
MRKSNRLVLLGTASLFVAAASVASASNLSAQISNQFVNQASTVVVQAQAMPIASGEFVAAEAPTTGSVRITTEDGHRYLELDGAFSTSEQGPDLHVLLDTATQPPQNYQNMGQFVNLGSLSSYSGMQRYPIPDSVDISNFQSVVIWCRMANATFGYAPLQSSSRANLP